MFRTLTDLMAPRPGEAILDVGCGAGSLDRLLARRLGKANAITAIDTNPFLLREAQALAKADSVDDRDFARAGRLWGAVEAEEERAPVGQWENERGTYEGRVLAHAGEAKNSRVAFQALSPYEQDSLIEFLKTLQVLPPGTKERIVDENFQAQLSGDLHRVVPHAIGFGYRPMVGAVLLAVAIVPLLDGVVLHVAGGGRVERLAKAHQQPVLAGQ